MCEKEKKIKEIVCNCLGIDSVENSDRLENLGTESIDHMDLCFRLEKEFGVKFNKNFETVQSILDFLKQEESASLEV